MLGTCWRWVEFGFALLALSLLTLACHALWPDKDGVAAWFQAIGSVAAIAIAVYVPWRQRADSVAEERRRYFQSRADGLMLLIVLAHEVEAYLDGLSQRAQPSPAGHKAVPFHIRESNVLKARLEAFQDRTQLEVCASLAYELRKAMNDIAALQTELDSAVVPPGGDTDDPLGIQAAIGDARRVIWNIGDTHRNAMIGVHTARPH